MKTNRGRLRRALTALAGVAAIATMGLALATSANASESGDWYHHEADAFLSPGETKTVYPSISCKLASGCTLDPSMTIYIQAYNGATFSPAGASYPLVKNSDSTQVGTCTSTSTRITCTIDGTYDIPEPWGVTPLGGEVVYPWSVTAPTNQPPGTLIAVASWNDSSGHLGLDPTSYYMAPEASAPMGDPLVAGGIGGAALLVGGAFALRRRRQT